LKTGHDRVPAETKRDRTAELPKITPGWSVVRPFSRAPKCSSGLHLVNTLFSRKKHESRLARTSRPIGVLMFYGLRSGMVRRSLA